MKLIIEEYWNKVERFDGMPFGSRVLPEYERKSRVEYPESGWNDLKEWQKSVIHRNGFQGFDDQGRAKFDQGRTYGIHSYQLVSVVEQ